MTAAASAPVSAAASDETKDDTATTVDSTTVVPPPPSSPPCENKKRGASRQLTKDDDDDDDDDDDNESSAVKGESFKKADAATLAQRRIVKAKRYTDSTGSGGGTSGAVGTTTEGGDTAGNGNVADSASTSTTKNIKSNPFANALSGFGATTTTSTGFAGFRFNSIATTGAATIPGDGTTSTATTTSSGSTTNGAPVSGLGSGFLSFGAAAASSAPVLGFGSAFGSANNISNTSIFGEGSASTSKFGFTSSGASFAGAAPATSNATGASGDEAASCSTPAHLLPSDVEVTNGEEGEELRIEMRSKSFQLVMLEDGNDNGDVLSKDSIPPTVTTMSVPPSSSMAPSTTPAKAMDEKTSKEDSKADTNDGQIASSDEKDSIANDKEASTTHESQSQSQQQQRWSELGIGPLRVLRHRHSRKARVVQRRENAAGGQGTKLLLNAVLNANSKLTRPSDKHVQLVTVGTRQGAASSFLFKLRNPADAKLLERALQDVIDSSAATTTPADGAK